MCKLNELGNATVDASSASSAPKGAERAGAAVVAS